MGRKDLYPSLTSNLKIMSKFFSLVGYMFMVILRSSAVKFVNLEFRLQMLCHDNRLVLSVELNGHPFACFLSKFSP